MKNLYEATTERKHNYDKGLLINIVNESSGSNKMTVITQSVLNPCDAKMIDTIFHIVVIISFQLCIVALNIEPLGIHIN